MKPAPGYAALFDSPDPAGVRSSLHERWGSLIDEIGVDVDAAMAGSTEATYKYVQSYRRLAHELVDAARRSGKVRGDRDAGGDPQAWGIDLYASVEAHAANAPFSPWNTQGDVADAVALDVTNTVRSFIGAAELPKPSGWTASLHAQRGRRRADDLDRFRRQVYRCLAAPEEEHPLHRVMRVFGLSKAELGRLFGVRRQAIDGWLGSQVPADRQEKLSAVLALADLLERKLKTDRIAGVARRPAEAYGGETMLTMITADRHRELLEIARESFNWSQAA